MTPLPKHLQDRVDAAKDVETVMLQLAEDLKYPVGHDNTVMVLNYLNVPDFFHHMAYHLARCGYRRIEEKRLVKQRKVVGGQFADLVAYVPMDAPDDPITVAPPQPLPGERWETGAPKVNDIIEERLE